MKKIKILKISAFFVIVISCLITLLFGAKKIAEGKPAQTIEGYSGIVTVWQIDTFEGGVGSRRQFLANRAKEFSKKYGGVLFLVTSHTKESAENNFKNGIFPDVISFGCGVNVLSAEKLNNEMYNVGGSVGESVYATPWCRGGYFLIKHGKFSSEQGENTKNLSSVIVSKGDYTLPLMSAFLEEYQIKEFKLLPSFDAYKTFTLGKTPYLIGTQRDIARLKVKGENFSVFPLNSFCDLYQYAAVTTTVPKKRDVAENFIKYLLTEGCQNKLKDIFMIPVKSGASCAEELKPAYTGKSIKTISAFISEENLKQTAANLTSYFSGDLTMESKIKNVLL